MLVPVLPALEDAVLASRRSKVALRRERHERLVEHLGEVVAALRSEVRSPKAMVGGPGCICGAIELDLLRSIWWERGSVAKGLDVFLRGYLCEHCVGAGLQDGWLVADVQSKAAAERYKSEWRARAARCRLRCRGRRAAIVTCSS